MDNAKSHQQKQRQLPPTGDPKQEPRRLIRSVRCASYALEEQDQTIERMDAEGYSYLESLMLPGSGEIIMRFRKK